MSIKGTSFDLGAMANVAQDLLTAGVTMADGAVQSPHPVAQATNLVTNALGLPPVIGEAVKTGVGIALVCSGDVTASSMIADGALGLGAELLQNAPAVTEFYSGTLTVGVDEKGMPGYHFDHKVETPFGDLDSETTVSASGTYEHKTTFGQTQSASTGSGNTGGSGGEHGAGPVQGAPPGTGTTETGSVSSKVTEKDIEYLDALKTLESNWEALKPYITSGYEEAPTMHRSELETLAKSHPNQAIREAAQFLKDNPEYQTRANSAHNNDNALSLGELKSEIGRIETDIALYGMPEKQTSPVQGTQPTNPGETYKPANPGVRPPPGFSDRPITNPKLTPVEMKPQPVPPPGVGSPPGTGTPPGVDSPPPPPSSSNIFDFRSRLQDIMGDASLSVEERVMLILQLIMEAADHEMVSEMESMGSRATERADLLSARSAAADAKDNDKVADIDRQLARLDTEMQKASMRMQSISQKRTQMFQMATNISSNNHEMAMAAIRNMGQA